MKYTLRQLEVYHAIANCLSFTKAAQLLHLSQPAVSLQFKTFSDQFDHPLIQYQGKKFVLTDLGKDVCQKCERILGEIRQLEKLDRPEEDNISGTLHISSVSTGKYVAPFLLKTFLDDHPLIDIKLDVTNKRAVTSSLEGNTIDFALLSVMPSNIALETEALMDNELVLVSNTKNAQIINKRGFTDFLFLLREEGSATRQAMEKFMRELELIPRKNMSLTSNEAVKQSVIAGLGISVMPIIGIRNEQNNGS
jgi:DNA-binding transcriptional LysR family regulator